MEHSGDRQALTHLDASGNAQMVDVSEKAITLRTAEARGSVHMLPETIALIRADALRKGDVLGTARIAAIMAAKHTSDLIPLCHGLPLTVVEVEFGLDDERGMITIEARARTQARTGVEMEALTAVSVAALTIYDMCKAVDRGMTITDIRLVYKSGGRSGTFDAR